MNVTTSALRTYKQLTYLQDNHFCFDGFTQSNQQLADFLGCSIRTVQRSIKELKDSGIITTSKGFNGYNAFTIDRIRFQIVLEGLHLVPEQQNKIIPLMTLFSNHVNAIESAFSIEFQTMYNNAGQNKLSNYRIVSCLKEWIELHQETLELIYKEPSITATLLGLEMLCKEVN